MHIIQTTRTKKTLLMLYKVYKKASIQLEKSKVGKANYCETVFIS